MALRGPDRGPKGKRGSSMPGPHAWLKEAAGGVEGPGRGRTSAAVGHAAQATAGLPPPPPSPRPEEKRRRQRLMPRRASAKTPPDSGSDPQMPGPARTLKLSSRRHRQPARPPTAPLLSGLLDARAQCCRPRDSTYSEHARACRPVGKGAGASADEACSSAAAPPPPAESFENSPQNNNLPSRRAASGTEGLHPLECARGVNCTALPRHGIVRMPADASASSAQSSGITTTQSAP